MQSVMCSNTNQGITMKHLLLPLILFLSSCATTSSPPQDIELTGKVLGSYVSTSSGMSKGHILHVSDSNSTQKVSSVGNGNPQKILLVHKAPETLDNFSGKTVTVTGKIHSEHIDIFHTDFVLSIINISEQ
jgi:starvation-inducible outer membrane lipoprotein